MSQVGSAAHIAAARPKGPRYDDTMTHDRRSAPTNGLWLCETHAKLIDTDVSRFPTDLLHRWKRQLRHLNQRAVDHGLDIADQTEMIRLTRRCSLAEGNLEFATAWIGDFLDDVGASSVWGAEIADAARQALTELAQNDAQHGGASWARLESREYAIRLSTDGAIFSLEDLLGSSAPRGGGATISAFQAAYRDTHVLSAPRPGRRNVYFITDVRRPQRAHNPCSVSASARIRHR